MKTLIKYYNFSINKQFYFRMTIQVGYWNIRGLIGGVRLMLEYAGADWNETFYEGR